METTYKPMVHSKNGPNSGTTLVGTYSVIIGWTMNDPVLRNGLHGFALCKPFIVVIKLSSKTIGNHRL